MSYRDVIANTSIIPILNIPTIKEEIYNLKIKPLKLLTLFKKASIFHLAITNNPQVDWLVKQINVGWDGL